MEELTEQIPQINGVKKTSKIHVPIRTHASLKDESGELLTTLSLIKLLSNSRKPDGMSTTEMRSLFKALDKVEEAGESTVLEFEANEAKIILQLSKGFQYAIADRFFVEFEDSLS